MMMFRSHNENCFVYCRALLLAAIAASLVSACAPYQARRKPMDYHATGEASWYGPGFHGKKTASGERYNQRAFTAAHPTLPLGTSVKVTNVQNDRFVVVRINDRGPFVRGRIIDLSKGAAQKLGMLGQGTAEVKIVAISAPVEREKTTDKLYALKSKKGLKKAVVPDDESLESEDAEDWDPDDKSGVAALIAKEDTSKTRKKMKKIHQPAAKTTEETKQTPENDEF